MASRKELSSVSSSGMASTGGTLDSPVKQVQIEGLVRFRRVFTCALKIKDGAQFKALTEHRVFGENTLLCCFHFFFRRIFISVFHDRLLYTFLNFQDYF